MAFDVQHYIVLNVISECYFRVSFDSVSVGLCFIVLCWSVMLECYVRVFCTGAIVQCCYIYIYIYILCIVLVYRIMYSVMCHYPCGLYVIVFVCVVC